MKKTLRPVVTILVLTVAIYALHYSERLDASRNDVNSRPLASFATGETHANPSVDDFSMEDVRILFPNATQLTSENGILGVKDEQDRLLGFVAQGPPETVDITGHTGPVPFLIGLDTEFRIKRVYMLPNLETPYYSEKVSDELEDAWQDKKPEEAVQARVDAVTGATQTSSALIEGVEKTLQVTFDLPPATDIRMPTRRPFRLSNLLTLAFLVGTILYFSLPVSSRRSRFIINICSILIPGFYATTMLYLPLFRGWIQGSFSWGGHWILLLIAFFAFGIPLLKGRNFYCYHFCPFGAAQELINRISKVKWRPGKKVNICFKTFRALIIAAAFIIVITGAAVDLSLFEPFIAFQWPLATWFSRILAISFLIMSLRIARPWCRICPTGGLISLTVIRRKKK